MTWTERILGIVLGVILGVAVVVVFVFVYSEQTVDAPSISDDAPKAPREGAKGSERDRGLPRDTGRPTPVAAVRIIGGAPPPSGPVQLRYRKGEEINLRVISDQTVRLQALGLGTSTTVHAGQPLGWGFKASKTGDFPLLVLPSHIDVATITVRAPGA